MIVTAWCITKEKYQDIAFTGEGAEDAGGRWNSQGTRIVYASSAVSLSILEILVNLEKNLVLSSYVVIPFSFDDNLILELKEEDLPDEWAAQPPPVTSQQVGDDWAQSKSSLLLRVPSAVVPIESNYLLNPAHPDFDKIKIGNPIPLPFDERLKDLLK